MKKIEVELFGKKLELPLLELLMADYHTWYTEINCVIFWETVLPTRTPAILSVCIEPLMYYFACRLNVINSVLHMYSLWCIGVCGNLFHRLNYHKSPQNVDFFNFETMLQSSEKSDEIMRYFSKYSIQHLCTYFFQLGKFEKIFLMRALNA